MNKKRGRPCRKAPARASTSKRGRQSKNTKVSDKLCKNKKARADKDLSDQEEQDEPSDSEEEDICSENDDDDSDNDNNEKKKQQKQTDNHKKTSAKKRAPDKQKKGAGISKTDEQIDNDNNDNTDNDSDDGDNDSDNGDNNGDNNDTKCNKGSLYKKPKFSKGTYYILEFRDKNRRPIALQNKKTFCDTICEFEESLKLNKAVLLKYETKDEAHKEFKQKISVFDKKDDKKTKDNKNSSENKVDPNLSPEQQRLLDKMLANVSKFSRGPVLQLSYYYRSSTSLLIVVLKLLDSDRNEVWSFKNTAIAPSIQTWYSVAEHSDERYNELVKFLEPGTLRDPHGKPEDQKLSPKRPNNPNAKRWPIGGIWTRATLEHTVTDIEEFVRDFGKILLTTMRDVCFRPVLRHNMQSLNFGGMWDKLNESTKGPTLWNMLETATVKVQKFGSYDDLDRVFVLSESQKIDKLVNRSDGFA